MANCLNCGHDNPAGKNFCGQCGVALQVPCPNCSALCPPQSKFCGDCGQRLTSPSGETSEATSERDGQRRLEAERRLLTLVFVDMVDSTMLSTNLDPEELRDRLRAYHGTVGTVVERYGGVMASVSGDGIMAYFGYPQAHEDDAEQAVWAALDIIDAVAELPTLGDVILSVRIGIATGMVVVGDIVAESEAQESGVFGATPNLAARLQSLAQPGSIVVCRNTRRLIRAGFDCVELDPAELKGFSGPIKAYHVANARQAKGRLAGVDAARASPLLGRDEEVAFLLRRWQDAVAGRGRAVLLTGEAGIGKSRVTQALRNRLESEPHISMRYFCSAHRTNSAFFPFITQIEHAAGFERSDDATIKLRKLENLLEADGDRAERDLPLFAKLLSLPAADRALPQAASPQDRKKEIFSALLAELDRLSARDPVLMVLEDAHWIDPTSLELIAATVERIADRRVLLVITARPEFTPPWPGYAHVSTTMLTRLDRSDGATLIDQVAGGRALPRELMDQILERTDGVPLFIEELTRTVIESDALTEEGGHFVLARPLASLAIPTTLHASLVARLDRLDVVKEVAQIGAVVGREFAYELLRVVSRLPEKQLDLALRQLVDSQLVFSRGQKPYTVYTFKHALVRDAAYEGLLRSRRAQLHEAIAKAVRSQFPDTALAQPEMLAYHLSEAGLGQEALPFWLEAGRNAASRSANIEAIAHLKSGITTAEKLPEGAQRNRIELDFHVALGPCVIATQGPSSSEAVKVFSRAEALCAELDDPPEYGQVAFWLITARVIRGELPQAEDMIHTLLRVSEQQRPAHLNALRGHAMIVLFRGRIREAREIATRALDLFFASSEEDQLSARAAGQDAGAAALALKSWALWTLGDVDQAAERVQAAVMRAVEVDHPHTKAYVYYYASVVHALRGDLPAGHDYAEKCLFLSEEHGFGQWRRLARAVRNICDAQLNPDQAGRHIQEVKDALGDYRSAGYQLGITALFVIWLPALMALGKTDDAEEVVEQGLLAVEQNDERIFFAELLRQKALLRAAQGKSGARAEAIRLLSRSLEAARGQGARSLELRAAASFAALLNEGGDGRRARDLLEPVVRAWSEGSDTKDMSEAESLLASLKKAG